MSVLVNRLNEYKGFYYSNKKYKYMYIPIVYTAWIYLQSDTLCLKKCHGKIIVIDNKRNVDSEMARYHLKMVDVIEILDEGIQVTKRKKGIHEK